MSSQAASPAQAAKTAVRAVEALVAPVSNGDTVHVKLGGRDERLRMIGVNCPEVSHPNLGIEEQPYEKQAAAYTEKRLLKR